MEQVINLVLDVVKEALGQAGGVEPIAKVVGLVALAIAKLLLDGDIKAATEAVVQAIAAAKALSPPKAA